MPPRKKVADETAAALPGVMEQARRRRRRRRSRRRRSRSRRRRSRSRSRSLSQPQEMADRSRSASPSSRSSSATSAAPSAGSPSPVRRKQARSTKYGNVNPFINFLSSERARMGGSNKPASEVTRELGARWRAMPLEERQPYIAAAIKSREELERINQSSNIMEAQRRRRRRRRRGRGRRRRSRSRSRSRRRR